MKVVKDTILDCYTDEPSGLGVPPYLGTYPRYLAGKLGKVNYLTVDDLRSLHRKKKKHEVKTDIKIYNTTNQNVQEILKNTKVLYVVLGIHTPGKYLSAIPGTLKEVIPLIKDLKCKKVLAGPATFGTQLQGGRHVEKFSKEVFDEFMPLTFNFDEIREYAVQGASIIQKIPDLRVMEIETARGCVSAQCSFCTEPLKARIEFREQTDIHAEIKELHKHGAEFFRLGKQTCMLSYKGAKPQELESLLKPIANLNPKVLHIDNVNPIFVNEERVKLLVKYCTPGNIAAFGVESFDMNVIKKNKLNANPEVVFKATRILNEVGGKRGLNGMPSLLPGINILFGLPGETEKTHEENMRYLKQFLAEKLLLRRINIRQVIVYPNTPLEKMKNTLKKNRAMYWQWRDEIRKQVDVPMLQRLVPQGTVLKDVYTEIHDGNTTFCRQVGTYPLIVGVKERLPLHKFINIKVTNHMLRSIVGEKI